MQGVHHVYEIRVDLKTGRQLSASGILDTIVVETTLYTRAARIAEPVCASNDSPARFETVTVVEVLGVVAIAYTQVTRLEHDRVKTIDSRPNAEIRVLFR